MQILPEISYDSRVARRYCLSHSRDEDDGNLREIDVAAPLSRLGTRRKNWYLWVARIHHTVISNDTWGYYVSRYLGSVGELYAFLLNSYDPNNSSSAGVHCDLRLKKGNRTVSHGWLIIVQLTLLLHLNSEF